MKRTSNNHGFAPIVALLILAGIALFGYGAYRMTKYPPSSLAPQEQAGTESDSGGNDTGIDTAVEKGILEAPSIALKPSGLEEEKVQTEEEAFGVDFSRSGALLRQSGSGLEGWYILYDTPGNPATTNNLKFNEKSTCDMGQGAAKCDASTFTQGDTVQVDGNVQQNTVTVFLLKKI